MQATVRFKPADVLTALNGICGFLALAVIAQLFVVPVDDAPGLSRDQLVACLLLYGIGMVCDVLDGPVARRFGSSGLGSTLDTICDTISFGMLPAMLVVATYSTDPDWRIPALVAASFYVGATMLRLARHSIFEAQSTSADQRPDERAQFAGMPSPVGGNCLLAMVVLAPAAPATIAVTVLVAILLIANFPYPNNSSYGGIFVGALLIASFAGIAGLISLDVPAVVALVGLLPIGIYRAARSVLNAA